MSDFTSPPTGGPSPDDDAHDSRDMTWTEGVVFSLVSGLLYVLAATLNRWVPDTRVVIGADLFFLPAGVKWLALLLGRHWAIPGLWVSNFLMAQQEWEGAEPVSLFLDSGAWILMSYGLVVGLLRLFRVGSDLGRLTYLKLVLVLALAALGQGCLFNTYQMHEGNRRPEDWLISTLGMALGDFLGASALVVLWLLGVRLLGRSRSRGH